MDAVVEVLLWLSIPLVIIGVAIAERRGLLRRTWLGGDGPHVLVLMLVPAALFFIALYFMFRGVEFESGGWSRVYHADGSCTERTEKNGKTSTVLHAVCPEDTPTLPR